MKLKKNIILNRNDPRQKQQKNFILKSTFFFLLLLSIFINLYSIQSIRKNNFENNARLLEDEYTIPRKLWISSQNTQDSQFTSNFQSTIKAYEKAWNTESVNYEVITDEICIKAISLLPMQGATTDLLKYHEKTQDSYKYICRMALLFLHGGYFLTASIQVIEPFVPSSNEMSFIAVKSKSFEDTFHPSFIASSAHHPIIYHFLKKIILFTQDSFRVSSSNYVGEILRMSFHEVTALNQLHLANSFILIENDLKNLPQFHSIVRKQGTGPECDNIIYDPTIQQVYFYTKFVGFNSKECRASSPAIPRILWISPLKHSEGSEVDFRFQENLIKTTQAYQSLWQNENIQVEVLSSKKCISTIVSLPMKGASWYLLDHYLQNRFEHENNFDICAVALLFTYGGFYLHGAVEVIDEALQPFDFYKTQVIAVKKDDGNFLTSFLASSPKHPMMHEILHMYMLHKRGEIQFSSLTDKISELWALPFNDSLLRERVFHDDDESIKEQLLLLKESRIDHLLKVPGFVLPLEREQSNGCNFIIYNDQQKDNFHTRKAYFYTRFVGSGDLCSD